MRASFGRGGTQEVGRSTRSNRQARESLWDRQVWWHLPPEARGVDWAQAVVPPTGKRILCAATQNLNPPTPTRKTIRAIPRAMPDKIAITFRSHMPGASGLLRFQGPGTAGPCVHQVGRSTPIPHNSRAGELVPESMSKGQSAVWADPAQGGCIPGLPRAMFSRPNLIPAEFRACA